jgi:hypothetical protein
VVLEGNCNQIFTGVQQWCLWPSDSAESSVKSYVSLSHFKTHISSRQSFLNNVSDFRSELSGKLTGTRDVLMEMRLCRLSLILHSGILCVRNAPF